MGNICPWCRKNPDELYSSNNHGDASSLSNSQRSFLSSEVNDRTPLLGQSGNPKAYHQSGTPVIFTEPTNAEPLSVLTTVVPPPPPPVIHENPSELAAAKFSSNETAESSMAVIVERMLPDLIDVGGWGAGTHQNNPNGPSTNGQNDQLKQLVSKSLQSTRVSSLPDAGTSNLSSLLSGRPISADICHFVAHTAGELSRLLIDEIKIVHKEELVVTFE